MDWVLFFTVLAGSIAGGVALLWLVGGYYWIRYYVRRRDEPEAWKCQPKRFLKPAQLRETMWLSTLNLSIGGALTGLMVYFLLQGWEGPKIYFEVESHPWGWAWAIGGTLVYFLLVDAGAYYAHRFMHQRFMFRHIHRWHHRYVATVPWVVTAMHPLEFLIFQVVSLGWIFLIPFHYLSIIVVLVYVLAFNIIDHSGVDLKSRLPWQGPSRYHDDHHVYFHVNFGQHLMLWDRMHGTLRRQGRKYGAKVFGGKGAPAGEEGELPPFVEY